jgi:hypothetical protein
MKKLALAFCSWLVVLAAAAPFWGCGQVISVTLTRGTGPAVEGKIELNGAKRTFQGVADANGHISWNIEGCSGSAQVAPGSTVLVSCSDPLLMEWPTCWSLTNATWSAPDLGLSGVITAEPAGSYSLDPMYGSIVTDSGYSAWVLNMDVANIGPTRLIIEMDWDASGCAIDGVCIKALDVATVVPILPPGQPRQIVPTEGLGVDFTAFSSPDMHVLCVAGATPTENSTWGKLKVLYR